ncbi:hypothetical protein M0R45_015568 [Rubus argutus]|uniref:Uncharacterized protein n=1 Tax=Rubus argutus TaxID=59490 RepID=A0AAW1XPM7_RUBAR
MNEESFLIKSRGIGVFGNDAKDMKIPVEGNSDPPTKELAEKVGRFVEEYIEAMEKVKLKQGLQIAMNICSEGNRYLQGSKFWKLYKVQVLEQLNLAVTSHISLCDDIKREIRLWEIVPLDHKIGEPDPLFKELKDEDIEPLRKKFVGSRADRKVRGKLNHSVPICP